jgi:hypothetical protein
MGLTLGSVAAHYQQGYNTTDTECGVVGCLDGIW